VVLNQTDVMFLLKFRLRRPLAENVNIYFDGDVVADALANCRRHAAIFYMFRV